MMSSEIVGAGVFNIFAFIVVIGILVTVHEYGHFWVARKMGVKVLRFSVGFGKPLWSWRGKSSGADEGTEYVIAAIPLGGYVKMLGEGDSEEITEAERHQSFDHKPLAARAAIVVAGPLFNFLFAIAAFAAIQMIGVSGLKPIIGEVAPNSVAAEAGMRSGEEIVAVDGEPVRIWQEVIEGIVSQVVVGDAVKLSWIDSSGVVKNGVLRNPFGKSIPEGMDLFEKLGFSIGRPKLDAVIGEVVADSAAQRAGLESGDRVFKVAGEKVNSWGEWAKWIKSSPGESLSMTVIRDDIFFNLTLTPEEVKVGEKTIGRAGVMAYQGDKKRYRELWYRDIQYGPIDALWRGVEKSWELSSMTLQVMGRMLTGATSTDGLSGPISIAKYAGNSMDMGIVSFLSFLGLVSVSLGVLNLLPIPMLDGGHLFHYLIEWIRGEPLPENAMLVGQKIGIIFLVGLMSLALYNDILRLN
ncbi:MAG: RIP metalloprotease RseP [Thiotrichales bacterium]|jgi:regulator of sigma E protease|nr:RIP metalloprotease RseP [Thiotrichales bacterium]MBT3614306.1 RIP metalloprotease RseP [Thiotrichales bacterium]MBT3752827.1 RIP metalloprotease RseP [Thiotrichales bacterium]MBT3837965.1 RIP metalloprotease RseP [Thiotrichales bacterium]MBT4152382.1 RIP metalloprotease RseP [Thiotrichales bacterium]